MTAPAPAGRHLVGLAAILTLAMACATFMGSAISVLAPFLVADLGVSRSEFGWLFTALAAVGAVGSVIAGRVTDSVGGRRMLAGLFVVVAVSLVGASAAPRYAWLVAAVLLAGLPNAAANPATNQLIATRTQPGRRGMIIGVKQSGVAISVFLAGAVLPAGAMTIGWRPTLAFTAVVPILGLLVAMRIIPRVGERSGLRRTRAPTIRVRQPAAIRWIAVYGFLMGAGGAVIFSYLPLYAFEEVGLTATQAGAAAALLGVVAVVARFVWGWRTERLADFAIPLGVLALASVVATLAIWAAATSGAWLLWAGAVMAGASVAAWNAVGMLAVVILSDVSSAGRASGLVIFGFLGGYTLSPVLFGYAADTTGSYDLGWSATTGVLFAAVVVTWLWRRSERRAAARAA